MDFQLDMIFNETFCVSKDRYQSFIALSNDKNPLHTNLEFAKSKGFEGVVMHGNILNSFLSYFIGECLPVKNVIIHAQDIQFKKPVYMNDELDFSAKVMGVYESVNAVEFKYTFKNDQSKVVAKGKFQIGLI